MAHIDDRVNVGLGVLVINDDGHVLLGKRLAKHGAGEYGFPGGKPDPGESPEEGAARELAEECGLIVPPDALMPLGLWTYDRFEADAIHFVTLYFIAPDVSDQEVVNLEPEKLESWDWYDPQALPAPLFCGIDRVIGAVA